ncbi:hypothetical protein BJ508DRAFT_91191 [Ascobolus immersus RN42]|uniref:Uncharacterized protein n=1 Tax=Ascobolus immersus RN42 TaxID=1160509 RepID=A0A3N4I8G3_ASCIM|nr:hypothetical protein BJ508DRAFT_91191 [Ascobolus immersus RN42]
MQSRRCCSAFFSRQSLACYPQHGSSDNAGLLHSERHLQVAIDFILSTAAILSAILTLDSTTIVSSDSTHV